MKTLFQIFSITFFFLIAGQGMAQSTTCCTTSKDAEKKVCCTKDSKQATTSGCTPSACRGAQTKFGEAKVISALREDLINLKAIMETYETINFDERTYSVHGIVGETDDESISIIADEVRIIEGSFSSLMQQRFEPFELPQNKARQVAYLKKRISSLTSMLKA
ncbi:MAG: hypothetical protein AAF502_16320 [Bacteroidota bacterium]